MSQQISIRRNHRDGSISVRIPREVILRAQNLTPEIGAHAAINNVICDQITFRLLGLLTPKRPENPAPPKLVR